MSIKEGLKEYSWLSLLLSILLIGCQDEITYTPKPRSYPKIDFPAKQYSAFNNSDCNFSFQMPTYAVVKKKKDNGAFKVDHPCWFDIEIPQLNGSIHCTYRDFSSRKELGGLIQDSYTLAEKHTAKAQYIDDKTLDNGKVQGLLFDIQGPTATSVQFFLTDSTSNYFQASLYFNNPPEPDSMAPIVEYVRKDIDHLIETFAFDR